MHYYPHNIADYRKDTRFLTKLQHWAYRELLDEYYLSEEPITKNEKDLFWRMGATTDEEQDAIKTVLLGFFEETENGFIHKRCDVEIQIFKEHAAKRSRAGKASGKSRRGETNTCSTHVQHEVGDVEQTKNQETIPNIHVVRPMDVNVSIWEDYMHFRKVQKKPIYDATLKAMRKEAVAAGINLNQAITTCLEHNWIAFKADWYEKVKGKPTDGNTFKLPGK
jgi:uncharacterized protein YdaU (DUF1376 family)